MKAKFKCLPYRPYQEQNKPTEGCGYVWEEEHKGMTECPKCGHLYVEWINYEEMRIHHLSKGGTGYGGRDFHRGG